MIIKSLHFLFFSLLFGVLVAQPKTDIAFPAIGKVQTRHANQIASSNWSIGGETMDRDLVDFESWKEHLGPLGAKKIRLQAGWTKCETQKGVYDFQWLDEIIDFCVAQGVEPWLQTSYGNPIYEGGGGIHLSAGIPSSEEALNAWDNWVRALAKRYSGRVKCWEIWNEPDNFGNNSAEDYARLFIRTTEIIRASIPDAQILALSMGSNDPIYIDTFLSYLKERDKLHLVNDITMHGYTYKPEDAYPAYEKAFKVVRKYSNEIAIRQGELGCPSENQSVYALQDYDWTELSQSKWVLRKMLGDFGRDIPSSYFLIIDIVYTHNHEVLMPEPQRNTKGLLKSDLNRNFVAIKQSYFAYQNTTSIFDNTLERIKTYPFTVNSEESLSLFAYQTKHFDKQIVTVWKDAEIPTNSNKTTLMSFEFTQGNFKSPVLVDLQTGIIYKIPAENWKKNGTHYTFNDIPVYDSPILIADESLVQKTK